MPFRTGLRLSNRPSSALAGLALGLGLRYSQPLQRPVQQVQPVRLVRRLRAATDAAASTRRHTGKPDRNRTAATWCRSSAAARPLLARGRARCAAHHDLRQQRPDDAAVCRFRPALPATRRRPASSASCRRRSSTTPTSTKTATCRSCSASPGPASPCTPACCRATRPRTAACACPSPSPSGCSI